MTVPPVIELRRSGSRSNEHLLKPPVNNKQMWEPTGDFIVQVVGGPNQRTDFHVDPYEEWFYQIKGDMHVNLMTDEGARTDRHPRGRDVAAARATSRTRRSGPRPAPSGMVIERVREEGTLEKFQWYCAECASLVHEVELQVRDIVADLPPVFEAFYGDEEARTCTTAARCTRARADDASPTETVDVHTHYVPRGWPAAAGGGPRTPRLRVDGRARRDDHARLPRVPPDHRPAAGMPRPGSPTWTPTASTCRSSRRPRCSSPTTRPAGGATKVARDLQRPRAGDLRAGRGPAGAVLPGAAAGHRRRVRASSTVPRRRARRRRDRQPRRRPGPRRRRES